MGTDEARKPISHSAAAAISAAAMIAISLGLTILGPNDAARLSVPILGAIALSLGQLALTDRPPSAVQFVQDAVVLAVLTAGRNESVGAWQLPGTWQDLFHITPAGVTIACAAYFLASGSSLLWADRHLALLERAAIALMPFAFNLLLALGATGLMRQLGEGVSFVAAVPEAGMVAIGRAILLFLLGETLVALLVATMRGHWLRDRRLHLLLLLSTAHAALTPIIADLPTKLTQLGALESAVIGIACAALAQAGLWASVFLTTGVLIDALLGKPPTYPAARKHWQNGLVKGSIYGGLFSFILLTIAAVLRQPDFVETVTRSPISAGALFGALMYPVAATIVASADETPPFFGRLLDNFRQPQSYLRGVVVGIGVGLALSSELRQANGLARFLALFVIGATAYAGVDIVYDLSRIVRHDRRRLQTWRVYGLGAVLGGLVAGALGWYFDAPQIAVVSAKFSAYTDLNYAVSGRGTSNYIIYALFNKWGAVDLGPVAGGMRLFYDESLSGVINWSLAAPLFSINYFVLSALMRRSLTPLKELFSARGVEGLVEQAVRVMRWGLWMAPVIYSFLRLAPDPSWYNQDGAVRTIAATAADLVLPDSAFRTWSLTVFTGLLAYDWLRVVIWFDHMGLRVATLVNLSFLGGDRADEAAARFAGHRARTRFIPEGIRRFATWAPLLIPFYIPRGAEWDTAWNAAEQMRATRPPWPMPVVSVVVAYVIAAVVGGAIIALVASRARVKLAAPGRTLPGVPVCLRASDQRRRLSNGFIALELLSDGRGYFHIHSTARKGGPIDITRRPSDPLQMRGPFFYLKEKGAARHWSIGYEPVQIAGPDYSFSHFSTAGLRIRNTVDDVSAAMELTLADSDCVAIQRVRLVNRLDRPRQMMLTSFQELALHDMNAYVRDPDFNSLHVETAFVGPLNAIFARNKLLRDGARKQEERRMSREMAFHAVQANNGIRLIGYEDSRNRFIDSGGLRHPRGVDGDMREPADEGKLCSFDPAASLTVIVDLGPRQTAEIVFVTGHARNEFAAADLIARYIGTTAPDAEMLSATLARQRQLQPKPALRPQIWPFAMTATELRLTHQTPRPWAHIMANPQGYGTLVSNEGETYSFSGNARHNGLTPFSFDSVPVPVPGQLIYVVDLTTGEADTVGFVPFRRPDARHDVIYGPGSATFKKTRAQSQIELTIFVPPDLAADVRLLTIRNQSTERKRFRIVPYFDMALDESPQDSLTWLETIYDRQANTLLFFNSHNDFQRGWAFVSTSLSPTTVETVRSRFVGTVGRDLTNPIMVETGESDQSRKDDLRRIAAFAGEIEVEAGAEASVVVVLGQAAAREQAVALAVRLRQLEAARSALQATRDWWTLRTNAVRIKSNNEAFDRLVNHWLPYQLLTSRLWGRTGPNQRGGATGFRDQLQDVLPLMFHDATLARRQILLHAGQQFPEGDVLKWWHAAPQGGTGLGQRTHASDPHLWLPYVVSRYVLATNDKDLLSEKVAYLDGPPVRRGTDTELIAPRPSREIGDVYEHCCRAIDYTLNRMGTHGLPLIGAGDWNDGLDLVGFKGRGESVWLAFFLYDVLVSFAQHLARDDSTAARYQSAARLLKSAIQTAWRDGHYVLAFDDSGVPLTSKSAMTAVWPILSGAVDYERGKAALERGLAEFERDNRILLLTPPFDERSIPYPGRIADYPAGVRENGGQYSHGVSWAVDAFVRLAEIARDRGDPATASRLLGRAFTCWCKISPLGKTDGAELAVYGLAPHQQPADIYDGAGYGGRGGWSWYTGSAARMLSAAYAILGLKMKDGKIIIPDDIFAPKGELRVLSVQVGDRIVKAPQKQGAVQTH
jgi:cyclic beta-1,2-glucan synthetase